MTDTNNEPIFEPENQTDCPNTGKGHIWIWDEQQDDYYCDECGVWTGNQE